MKFCINAVLTLLVVGGVLLALMSEPSLRGCPMTDLSVEDGCRFDWISNGRYCSLVDAQGNRVSHRAY